MDSKFIGHIARYTESIQKNISENDWDSLSDLLSKRQKALEFFFSNIDSAKDKEEAIEIIKKIQTDDTVFLCSLQSKKQEHKKKYTSLKRGIKSVKAYQI